MNPLPLIARVDESWWWQNHGENYGGGFSSFYGQNVKFRLKENKRDPLHNARNAREEERNPLLIYFTPNDSDSQRKKKLFQRSLLLSDFSKVVFLSLEIRV